MEEAFQTLIEINMKLNPKKCTFGIEEGMFLGYKVSTRGLKVCSDKVDAILGLPSPKCLKDVQKLNGKLASLNRFLAKSAEKSLSFFKTLKKCTRKSDFYWTTEAKEAFKKMKQLIAELPMLVAPMEKEELIVYLAAAKETVSAVLMTEGEAKQMPIYFVTRALRGLEVNYTSMEKLVLALVHASNSLKRYLQAHPIIVITDQPIQQILADFIVEQPEEESSDTLIGEEEELPELWILFTDGSSCTDGSGAGLILTNPKRMEFTYALRFRFDATNNEAEYEALIAGLKIVEQMGVKNLQANVDSRLVANQVNGTYVAKETDMVRYLEKVKTLTNNFKAFSIKQVPRSENKKEDALSKIASTSFAYLSKQVLVAELKEKSISAVEVLAVVEEEWDTWMTPIFKYLMDGTLPIEHAHWYMIRRGESLADWLLLVNHARGHKKADKGMPRLPSSQAYPKESSAKAKLNQIEAKPVATITRNQIRKFVWDNIICRFGIPGEIISHNGKQFQDNPFKDWCEKFCIRQHFASVKHPQTNGLVERANCSLGEGIKARLDERSKNWKEELPYVLWAHRTMIKSTEVDLVQNDEALEINLDLLEERREQAAIREEKSKAKMERYYHSKVHNINFKPGDLVYRNNDASCAEDTWKLGPKWEGPYKVTEALGKGAYKLRGRDGKQLPRTWNISNLKKCYVHQM
ncbi:reverse transcriptase domain-containing protein [Tanacetum coccineum]